MSQTKKQVNGRGRPKKWFDSIKETKSVDTATNGVSSRGRPKKVRKIDDSINTKIDSQKKSIAKIEKANEEISKWIWVQNFSTKKIEKSNWDLNSFEFNTNQKADNFALIILICSMLFFMLALGKTFLVRNNNLADLEIKDLSDITQIINNPEVENVPDDEFIPENTQTVEYIGENIEGSNVYEDDENPWYVESEIYVPENVDNSVAGSDSEILHSFYNHINNLDFSDINASVDKYLKNSDVFRTYFSQNRLTHFSDKISENGLSISNINLKSGDENSTRYYLYNVTYQLKETWEIVEEEREAAIVKRNDQYLIWSLRCVTTWCSKMPFFQK